MDFWKTIMNSDEVKEELKRQEEQKQEELRQEKLKQEEEQKQEEERRQEELRQEKLRQEKLKQEEEQKRIEEEVKRQKELRQEEERRQEELRQEKLKQEKLKQEEEQKRIEEEQKRIEEEQKRIEEEVKRQEELRKEEEELNEEIKRIESSTFEDIKINVGSIKCMRDFGYIPVDTSYKYSISPEISGIKINTVQYKQPFYMMDNQYNTYIFLILILDKDMYITPANEFLITFSINYEHTNKFAHAIDLANKTKMNSLPLKIYKNMEETLYNYIIHDKVKSLDIYVKNDLQIESCSYSENDYLLSKNTEANDLLSRIPVVTELLEVKKIHIKGSSSYITNSVLIVKLDKPHTEFPFTIDDKTLLFALVKTKVGKSDAYDICHFIWSYNVINTVTIYSNNILSVGNITEYINDINTILIYKNNVDIADVQESYVNDISNLLPLIYTDYITVYTHNVGLIDNLTKKDITYAENIREDKLRYKQQCQYITDKISETINNRFPTIGLFQEVPVSYIPEQHEQVFFSEQWSYVSDHTGCTNCKKSACTTKARKKETHYLFAIVFSKHFLITSVRGDMPVKDTMMYDATIPQSKRTSGNISCNYCGLNIHILNVHLSVAKIGHANFDNRVSRIISSLVKDINRLKLYYAYNKYNLSIIAGDFNMNRETIDTYMNKLQESDIKFDEYDYIDLDKDTNISTDNGVTSYMRLDYMFTIDEIETKKEETVEERISIFDHNLVSYKMYLANFLLN
jgi:endonuclease/exonuclease/phosphatase family metal-dependent hydrolase